MPNTTLNCFGYFSIFRYWIITRMSCKNLSLFRVFLLKELYKCIANKQSTEQKKTQKIGLFAHIIIEDRKRKENNK